MTLLPKSKTRLCALLWILLAAITAFQNGNNFPALLGGNNIFTGRNTFPMINKTCYADQQAGATADVKINACFTILGNGGGSTGGGIVDATGFGASVQSIASTVTIPRFVTLQFAPVTFVQAGSSNTNLFILKPDAVLDGLTFDCANQPSYSGTVIANDGISTYGSDTTPSASSTAIRNTQSTHSCQSVATGTFISLNAPVAGTYVFNFLIQDVVANGLLNGMLLQSAGVSGVSYGWINGIRVVNFLGYQNINCIHFTTGTNGQLDSNIFYYSCEAGGTGTNVAQKGVLFDGLTGTSLATGNMFIGNLWDYQVGPGVPFAQTTTAARGNYFIGEIDGTPTDVNSGNYWLIQPNLNIFKASGVTATFGAYGSPIVLPSNAEIDFNSSANTSIATDNSSMYIKAAGNVYFGPNGSSKLAINSSGIIDHYGNFIATAGNGVPAIFGATSQKAETTTADANVLTFTPPAVAGNYRACATISVSSATSGVIGWTLSWTDSNGNAQSNIAQSLVQQGTAAPALTFTTSAAGNYSSCSTIDVNNAAASIVVKWVGGGTTTAKMSATIERVI